MIVVSKDKLWPLKEVYNEDRMSWTFKRSSIINLLHTSRDQFIRKCGQNPNYLLIGDKIYNEFYYEILNSIICRVATDFGSEDELSVLGFKIVKTFGDEIQMFYSPADGIT